VPRTGQVTPESRAASFGWTVIPHLDLTVVGLVDTSVAFEDLTQAVSEDVYMRLLEIAEGRT
jgi:hypothetical protein